MTKDRTEQFRIIRTKIRRPSDSDDSDENSAPVPDKQALVKNPKLDRSYQAVTEIEVESPEENDFTRLFKQVEDIRNFINEVESQISEVSIIQSRILSSPIPDERSKRELEDFMAAVKRTSLIIRKRLKEMDSLAENEGDTSGQTSMACQRMCKSQHAMLLKSFVNAMMKFQTLQTDYRDACKERICRQLEISGSHFTDEQVEEMLEEGNWEVFTKDIVAETGQARKMLGDIEARHDELIKLEQSIRELHGMFMEMAILVESQGGMIDRIDFHVTTAQDYVEKGKKLTKQAETYKKSATKKKIILYLGLFGGSGVLLLIVLIILFK